MPRFTGTATLWLPTATTQDKVDVLKISHDEAAKSGDGWMNLPEDVRITGSRLLDALKAKKITHQLWWPGFPMGHPGGTLHRIYIGRAFVQFGTTVRGKEIRKMELNASAEKKLAKVPEWAAFVAVLGLDK